MEWKLSVFFVIFCLPSRNIVQHMFVLDVIAEILNLACSG